MSEIIIIAAVSENNVIGKDGRLPWDIKEDLERFKKLTLNHAVIMGRKTYESLPTKPLIDRLNVVLTRDENFTPADVVVKHSLKDAIEFCKNKNHEKIFIIGGQSLFEEGLKLANTLELTKVKGNYDGDAFFPDINFDEWTLTDKDERKDYSFLTYARRN